MYAAHGRCVVARCGGGGLARRGARAGRRLARGRDRARPDGGRTPQPACRPRRGVGRLRRPRALVAARRRQGVRQPRRQGGLRAHPLAGWPRDPRAGDGRGGAREGAGAGRATAGRGDGRLHVPSRRAGQGDGAGGRRRDPHALALRRGAAGEAGLRGVEARDPLSARHTRARRRARHERLHARLAGRGRAARRGDRHRRRAARPRDRGRSASIRAASDTRAASARSPCGASIGTASCRRSTSTATPRT